MKPELGCPFRCTFQRPYANCCVIKAGRRFSTVSQGVQNRSQGGLPGFLKAHLHPRQEHRAQKNRPAREKQKRLRLARSTSPWSMRGTAPRWPSNVPRQQRPLRSQNFTVPSSQPGTSSEWAARAGGCWGDVGGGVSGGGGEGRGIC